MKRPQILLAATAVAAIAGFTACGSSSTDVPVVTSTTYVSILNSANESNASNTSTATGTATYILKGNSLAYTVTVNGLTGPATASHIHVGPAGKSGGVLQGFTIATVASGTLASGTIDLTQPIVNGTSSSITGDSLKVLLNTGNAYTNVHTSAFPGGEIRAQIIKQ